MTLVMTLFLKKRTTTPWYGTSMMKMSMRKSRSTSNVSLITNSPALGIESNFDNFIRFWFEDRGSNDTCAAARQSRKDQDAPDQ